MHDKYPAAGIAYLPDKIAHEIVRLVVIQTQPVLDGNRDVHGVLHGFNTVGHQIGLGHQTGANGAALDALRRTTTIKVDFVIAPLPAQACRFSQGLDRKSTRLNSSHYCASRMPSSA